MANLPRAKQSPRVCNGAVMWYQGDTFEITFELRVQDQDGEPVEFSTNDTIEMRLIDRSEQAVEIGENVDMDLDRGTITLMVDDALSQRMYPGDYRLTIAVMHTGLRTTLLQRCRVVVE